MGLFNRISMFFIADYLLLFTIMWDKQSIYLSIHLWIDTMYLSKKEEMWKNHHTFGKTWWQCSAWALTPFGCIVLALIPFELKAYFVYLKQSSKFVT